MGLRGDFVGSYAGSAWGSRGSHAGSAWDLRGDLRGDRVGIFWGSHACTTEEFLFAGRVRSKAKHSSKPASFVEYLHET